MRKIGILLGIFLGLSVIALLAYLLFLNNDTEVDKDWLVELYKCIDSNSDIFACCSQMIRYDDRNIIDDAGDEYTLLGWGRKIGDGENIHSYNFY